MGEKQLNGFVYEIIDSSHCYVKNYQSMVCKEELVFPKEVEGVPVTKICANSFVDTGNYSGSPSKKVQAKLAIRKVIIPDSVSEIVPPSNYYKCNVETINVPENYEKEKVRLLNYPCIQEFFVNDNNRRYQTLDGVVFTNDKKELICYPKGNKRKKYDIPKGTETICEFAFDMHDKYRTERGTLKEITIPPSVTTLQSYAFCYCEAKLKMDHNHIEILGTHVFPLFEKKIKTPLRLDGMMIYRGGAFHISEREIEKVSFSPACMIEYSPSIDFREYLYFNIMKILKNENKRKKNVSYSFDYDTLWYSSKFTHHFFNTIVTIKDKEMLDSIQKNSEFIKIKNIDIENNTIVYKFNANPQRMTYGQRTYKLYLDGFQKLNSIINNTDYKK